MFQAASSSLTFWMEQTSLSVTRSLNAKLGTGLNSANLLKSNNSFEAVICGPIVPAIPVAGARTAVRPIISAGCRFDFPCKSRNQ